MLIVSWREARFGYNVEEPLPPRRDVDVDPYPPAAPPAHLSGAHRLGAASRQHVGPDGCGGRGQLFSRRAADPVGSLFSLPRTGCQRPSGRSEVGPVGRGRRGPWWLCGDHAAVDREQRTVHADHHRRSRPADATRRFAPQAAQSLRDRDHSRMDRGWRALGPALGFRTAPAADLGCGIGAGRSAGRQSDRPVGSSTPRRRGPRSGPRSPAGDPAPSPVARPDRLAPDTGRARRLPARSIPRRL